ncbi:MAG: transcriptional regulator [Candidatus Portnoybacteria bacterium RBG_19FT_COMBO_36_7]|uniref:Probable transcriptional regulatory protein A2Y98_01450 n=1 Tax=Candidatus Portnoybacteria bacterium RBG_19FT_COMBO_36_7 TaxID=1801992 RepID=A0A1G2F7P1_9BACT|nr:MAG: transcriptional regulator [Candidatus Portnoybacteria bacterium RBG_19FT_COMBO_36_7]
MSGHSKWSQIKHKKAITDAKKGKLFSKLSNLISVVARQKGGDPDTNPQLRLTIEKARSFNMPNEKIERAIKKGLGDLEGIKMEELTIEAYGPGGTALIIETLTDNKNRTVSEIKYLLGQHSAKMAQAGSVLWLFERKGAIVINSSLSGINKENLELLTIDCGADDLRWQTQELLEVYTRAEDMEKVKKSLEAKSVKPESVSLDWIPKNEIKIEDVKIKESMEKLLEALDEHQDVQEIYSNSKISN